MSWTPAKIFGTVWDVFNALRAHDSRMDIFVEQIQLPLFFDKLQNLIFACMVERAKFKKYLRGLCKNINPSITVKDAVEMLARHVVTNPVFESLFKNYSFFNNAVSKSMQKIFNLLDTEDVIAQLEKFYNFVCELCKVDTTSELSSLQDFFYCRRGAHRLSVHQKCMQCSLNCCLSFVQLLSKKARISRFYKR